MGGALKIVTALRPERRGRVAVELDGSPWRSFSATVVAAAGLRVGLELDREQARELRRALRRIGAVDEGARALARRDLSRNALGSVLERRGVALKDRGAAVETLERLGYIDDAAVAVRRAASLAERGYGDEGIRFDLAGKGISEEQVEAALAPLEPEPVRARRFFARKRKEPTAAALFAKGFSGDTVETLLGIDSSL